MKKAIVVIVCILALLFVSCDPELLKPQGGGTDQGSGDGGSGQEGGQSGSGQEGGQSGSGGQGESGGQSGSGDQGESGGQSGSGGQGESGGADDASGSGSGPVQSDYQVGGIGPAGGYIFYDRGYYENGWRYLEAAPADMRVLNGYPTVDATSETYANAEQYVLFGYYRKTNGGADLFVNGTETWQPTDCTGGGLGDGIRNTQLLLDAMGESAYVVQQYAMTGDKTAKSSAYAAKLVDLLTVKVGDKTYSDWFIPSLGELNQMYQQLYLKGLGGFGAYTYTSSSESNMTNYAQKPDQMKAMSFETGLFDKVVFRGNGNRIRPARAF